MEKYVSTENLRELVQLIKGDIRRKQDVVQFTVLPDPSSNAGKIVQYIGATQAPDYIKGLFYCSNGTRWVAVSTSSPISIVDNLPAWDAGEDNVLYFSLHTRKLYIRSSIVGQWTSLSEQSLSIKQYPDSEHYDPSAELPEEPVLTSLENTTLTAISDTEINQIFAEV